MGMWEALRVGCGGYSQQVDMDVYKVAKLILQARKKGGSIYVNELSRLTGLSLSHVELIQYLLAGASGSPALPFDYGTSPRGLFVCDLESCETLIKTMEKDIKEWENEDV